MNRILFFSGWDRNYSSPIYLSSDGFSMKFRRFKSNNLQEEIWIRVSETLRWTIALQVLPDVTQFADISHLHDGKFRTIGVFQDLSHFFVKI